MRSSLRVVVAAVFPLCGVGGSAAQAVPPPATPSAREAEIHELRAEVQRISARLAALEAEEHTAAAAGAVAAGAPTAAFGSAPAAASTSAVVGATAGASTPAAAPTLTGADEPTLAFFRGTTINVGIDGYYGYNFNQPIGRVNLLRAYDVTSNSFNLNQASLILERLPTATSRLGGRIDLQFGQATETLQGSSVNEERPQVWRNLYQVYGSYLAPVGSGLQLDFGKFASSLGNEGNYTKDQIAYSRAYLFNYLPFYHMGLRANYAVSPKVDVAYWLVNGANDTEDLNGYKSQAFLFTLKPASTVTWNVNYYFGEEGRDVLPTVGSATTIVGTQPGLPTTNISPAPDGREHIFDSYVTWQATKRLKLVGEADYVVNRTFAQQQPGRVVIAETAGQYALPRSWNAGWRAEYFDDRGGLFSGQTQALKEATVVLDHTFANGFLTRAEYRRDWSNRQYFFSDTAGALKQAQATATIGLVYWWGTKKGAW